jgi:uncharacterized protein Usg
MRTEQALALQLKGYRLATAEILYRLPDHPGLLQTYVWQDYDIAPRYPVLKRFLDFWTREIEGPLHSVRVAGKELISAAEMRVGTLFHVQ